MNKIYFLSLLLLLGCESDAERQMRNPYRDPLYVPDHEVDMHVKIIDGEGYVDIKNDDRSKHRITLYIEVCHMNNGNLITDENMKLEKGQSHRFEADVDTIFQVRFSRGRRMKVYRPLEHSGHLLKEKE